MTDAMKVFLIEFSPALPCQNSYPGLVCTCTEFSGHVFLSSGNYRLPCTKHLGAYQNYPHAVEIQL